MPAEALPGGRRLIRGVIPGGSQASRGFQHPLEVLRVIADGMKTEFTPETHRPTDPTDQPEMGIA